LIQQTEAIQQAPPAVEPVARLEDLTKVYRKRGTSIEVHALRGINLRINQGEYVALCGASGSGKSTMMNIVGCLDRPTTGRYLLGEEDVSRLSDDDLSDIRGRRLGFIFQNFNLNAQLTVLENVEVPLFYLGVPGPERAARAAEVTRKVGLEERGHHRPNELSGGQQQRVAIARALVNDPLVLLADEPTGNLDTATGLVVLEIFDQLHAQGKTIIMVTHERDVALRCKRIVTLRDGLIISDEQT
jgi:putative ABC transport system ATP-binding protein